MRPRGELRVGGVVAIAALIGTLVAGGAWFGHRGGESIPSVASRGLPARGAGERSSIGATAIPVEVDTVRRGTLVLEVWGTGQAEANRRAELAAPSAGRVASVAVRESAVVRAGQLLVRLDPLEAALAVERSRAALAEAQARYRDLTLFDDRISDPVVRRNRALGARARSGVAQAEVALRQAEVALAQRAILAPFAGRVAAVRVTAGEHVSAGEVLVAVVDFDPVRVEVQIVESELRWLREGGGAEVRLVAFPDTVLRGRIVAISPVVDPGTRSARVSVVVPNPAGTIRPGMFARVALEGRAFADRLLVPRDALLERDGRTIVFVFEPSPGGMPGEGLARWEYVAAGLTDGRHVEIVERVGMSGLAPGALVLTGGHVTLVHGTRVRISTGGP